MSPFVETKHDQVLVIEDLAHQYVAITTVIQDVLPDCRFVLAKNIRDAEFILEKVENPFGLIIMDLKLGEGSEEGLALLGSERLWHRQRTPVIVYTAVSNIEFSKVAYDMGVKKYIFKLDVESTQKLQMAVTRMLEGEARIGTPSRPLEYDIGLSGKQIEKPLQEKIKKIEIEEEVDLLKGSRDIALVLAGCVGALEVMLMLATTGSTTSDQLVDEAIREDNLLGTIAELRKCDLVIVSGSEVFITERGKRVVEKLRRCREKGVLLND
jgi:response regulator RpfG family c-di-GMP phosphodiesterase